MYINNKTIIWESFQGQMGGGQVFLLPLPYKDYENETIDKYERKVSWLLIGKSKFVLEISQSSRTKH